MEVIHITIDNMKKYLEDKVKKQGVIFDGRRHSSE